MLKTEARERLNLWLDHSTSLVCLDRVALSYRNLVSTGRATNVRRHVTGEQCNQNSD